MTAPAYTSYLYKPPLDVARAAAGIGSGGSLIRELYRMGSLLPFHSTIRLNRRITDSCMENVNG